MSRAVLPIAVFATAGPLVSGVTSAAARGAFANAGRNAGITWVSDTVIRLGHVDGTGRRVVRGRDGDGAGDPSWSPDGRLLAFYSRYSDTTRIGIVSPVAHGGRDLGSGASRSFAPTWSPDGKRIAVSEDWGSYAQPWATIKIVALATNTWTAVTKPTRQQADSEPAWSSDGRTIAFARTHFGGTPTLFLTNPDGSGLRRLTEGRSPTWSPDGKRLAFIFGRGIYVIRADSTGRKRVIGGLRAPLYNGKTFVRWSPDGSKLLYSSGADAWIANTDGTHRMRIVHERLGVQGIAWRPG